MSLSAKMFQMSLNMLLMSPYVFVTKYASNVQYALISPNMFLMSSNMRLMSPYVPNITPNVSNDMSLIKYVYNTQYVYNTKYVFNVTKFVTNVTLNVSNVQ